jgi:MoxR-like ATPase
MTEQIIAPRASLDAAGNGARDRTESLAATAAVAARVLGEVERAVVGKREVLELVLAGLLADGHVLLDDLPGVAKTLMARSFATAAGLDFSRLQFTPDMLPADITGALVLDVANNTPVFRAGPVFAQLVLADEINRAPAKTQAALLEAMQERQVTVDGTTHRLPRPFLVIATQNPIESEGTYPLPEAQLDRFILRTTVGYPSAADELELLARRLGRKQDEVELARVATPADFLAMQASLEEVHVDRSIGEYAVALVGATRGDAQLSVGSSPRGTLALIKLARAKAVLAGRDFITPDDVRAIAVPALSHRVVLRAEAWARRISPTDVVRKVIDRVPAPSWR